MPIYYYKCTHCDREVKKLLEPKDAFDEYFCPHDGHVAKRLFKPPTSHVKEVIDNGIQLKRVEQFADSPRLLEEREQLSRADKDKKDL